MTGRGARWLFVVLLVAELVLLTRQVSRRGLAGPRAEAMVVAVLGPVARSVVAVESAIGGAAAGMSTRRRLREENRRLAERLEAAERELLRRQGIEEDVLRLGAAVRYHRRTGTAMRLADVVYVDHASWLRSLLLHVGEAGVERNQPVIATQGLVGRVVVAADRYAKVQLVTDRASAVGAMLERTGRQGVVRGDGEGGLALDYLPLQADVRVGDRVVTAGIDGIYPRGIAIGVVTVVAPGTQLFHRIVVAPAVDFALLDHVYLLERQAPPELVEGDGRDLP
ncbi:MAG TPA: rod shape-determining protein MreC [Thermoanaerobaculia bacterium]|nr:rod shape-determining protein MreC [Thermoanaerobaculia bacterium]